MPSLVGSEMCIRDRVWVEPPGFINFALTDAWLTSQVDKIRVDEQLYGNSSLGDGKKVQVEFVSVNPTGPIHVGHARGAEEARRRGGTATSRAARAQKLLPAARQTSDPLSGFFAIRRSIVDGVLLQPVGFKILLELLVRTDVHAVVDIPYTFDQRSRADSKASILEGVRFLRHLIRLRSA